MKPSENYTDPHPELSDLYARYDADNTDIEVVYKITDYSLTHDILDQDALFYWVYYFDELTKSGDKRAKELLLRYNEKYNS
ncbi:MAG: hypothetical protein AAF571_14250 [Verrucomicrobiota bacterium]